MAQIQHGRLRQSHPVISAFRLVGIALAVAVASSACVAAYAAHDVVATAAPPVHIPQLPGRTAEPLPEAPAGQTVGEVNMLLVGTDTRTKQGSAYSDSANQSASSGSGNNDVNILLHISKNHDSISVVSFPRDLEIPIPSCPTASGGSSYSSSKAMLNTALSRGGDDRNGLSCAVLTVEQLTGLDIPYAASVTFKGTSAISSAIGGIPVCLATPIVDDNVDPALNLKAGERTLVGREALSFLRSRKGVGDGSDLGRISNQQVFMSSLARELTSSATLTNPFKLYSIASAASKNMLLSDTLNAKTLLGIIQAVQKVGLDNMVFIQYPVGQDPDDINRVIPNAYAAEQLNAALQSDQPVRLSGTTGDAAEVDTSPSATATATSAPTAPGAATGTPAASGNATPAPSKTSTPGSSAAPAVTLPPSVSGQTAAQKTCSKKGQY